MQSFGFAEIKTVVIVVCGVSISMIAKRKWSEMQWQEKEDVSPDTTVVTKHFKNFLLMLGLTHRLFYSDELNVQEKKRCENGSNCFRRVDYNA